MGRSDKPLAPGHDHTFGATLHLARQASGTSLTACAQSLGYSKGYASAIERSSHWSSRRFVERSVQVLTLDPLVWLATWDHHQNVHRQMRTTQQDIFGVLRSIIGGLPLAEHAGLEYELRHSETAVMRMGMPLATYHTSELIGEVGESLRHSRRRCCGEGLWSRRSRGYLTPLHHAP